MDWLLNFFSDLILFTAGIAVIGLWIVLLIEAYDFVFGPDDTQPLEGHDDA